VLEVRVAFRAKRINGGPKREGRGSDACLGGPGAFQKHSLAEGKQGGGAGMAYSNTHN